MFWYVTTVAPPSRQSPHHDLLYATNHSLQCNICYRSRDTANLGMCRNWFRDIENKCNMLQNGNFIIANWYFPHKHVRSYVYLYLPVIGSAFTIGSNQSDLSDNDNSPEIFLVHSASSILSKCSVSGRVPTRNAYIYHCFYCCQYLIELLSCVVLDRLLFCIYCGILLHFIVQMVVFIIN
jgi:ribosomal protein S14